MQLSKLVIAGIEQRGAALCSFVLLARFLAGGAILNGKLQLLIGLEQK